MEKGASCPDEKVLQSGKGCDFFEESVMDLRANEQKKVSCDTR